MNLRILKKKMNDGLRQAVSQQLLAAQKVLVVSHVRPDGDAVGSLLGLGLALQQAGKTVQMVLADGVPSTFRYLPGAHQIVRKISGSFDLAVVVDCSDLERVGGALNGTAQPGLNIDHHITNLNFAAVNWVEPRAVATSAILAANLPELGFTLSQPIATALLTGLVSDTLGFRTSNMTSDALRLGALLMDHGANLPELYQRALVSKSFNAARYWGAGLLRLQREDRMIWTSLTLRDRENVGYPGNDDADLVNVLSAIDDADLAIIFVEQKSGKVKISWRSQPGVDVSQVAVMFGGGGHSAASGAEVSGSLESVQFQVLQASRDLLAKNATSIRG